MGEEGNSLEKRNIQVLGEMKERLKRKRPEKVRQGKKEKKKAMEG